MSIHTDSLAPPMTGAVTGALRTTLRLEGLCVLLVATACYARYGQGWGWFATLFLVPDLAFLGYLAGARVGAIAYNLSHSYIGALACLLAGVLLPHPLWLAAGLIWAAHIGFDRALGYGLKYAQGFGFTHLGLIGKQAQGTAGTAAAPQAPSATAQR
ncbi:Uncharacterised protein [Comamonas aquatica]|uniref:DUF4260 domain-containing protein n=1 Tax=Comamonas aquatica TaxID=225991 RepID=UPI001EF1A794|nr:DUF4260 domain-containing protein [Comamonas aquatica]CAB5663081.1 Uncharacterised protein [Comamonas aquatica]CAC9210531.1 Uncharacterised protein [Comamonas aquatica]